MNVRNAPISCAVFSERLFTPKDFETDLLSHVGAAFSFEPRLTQSAWFRPHNQSAVSYTHLRAHETDS